MRWLLLLALWPTSLSAASVTITLTDDEQRAFLTLLDVAAGGGKAGGLEMAKAVTYFAAKIQNAKPPETAPPAHPENQRWHPPPEDKK